MDVGEERLDGFLVAFIKNPLADAARGDQFGPLQRGQVSRHGRLRQPGTRIDQAGADADVERVLLLREVRVRVLQPAKNLAPYRVDQRLVDRVNVDGNTPCIGFLRT